MPKLTQDLTLVPPQRSRRLVEQMRARDTQTEVHDLVELVEQDPVTTVHLLRQVNSPIHSLRQSVSSLDRAVTMLGFDAVANTIFVETHSKSSAPVRSPAARRAFAYLMGTSVAASRVADALAHFLKVEEHATVRTAALIHQLGRMALLSSDPRAYTALWTDGVTRAGKPGVFPPGIGQEIARFGIDYTRHGARIARTWNLPSVLVESIRCHADPDRADTADRHIVRVVAVSQYAARSLFESDDALDRDQGSERSERASDQLANAYGLSRSDLDEFLEDAKESAYRVAAALDL